MMLVCISHFGILIQNLIQFLLSDCMYVDILKMSEMWTKWFEKNNCHVRPAWDPNTFSCDYVFGDHYVPLVYTQNKNKVNFIWCKDKKSNNIPYR